MSYALRIFSPVCHYDLPTRTYRFLFLFNFFSFSKLNVLGWHWLMKTTQVSSGQLCNTSSAPWWWAPTQSQVSFHHHLPPSALFHLFTPSFPSGSHLILLSLVWVWFLSFFCKTLYFLFTPPRNSKLVPLSASSQRTVSCEALSDVFHPSGLSEDHVHSYI